MAETAREAGWAKGSSRHRDPPPRRGDAIEAGDGRRSLAEPSIGRQALRLVGNFHLASVASGGGGEEEGGGAPWIARHGRWLVAEGVAPVKLVGWIWPVPGEWRRRRLHHSQIQRRRCLPIRRRRARAPWLRLPRGGAKGTEERGGQGPPRRKRREHWEAAWIGAGARPRDVCAWGEGEEDRVSVREREERDGGRSGCGTCLQNHNGAPHGKVRH